jgi:multiple antibiotic resistance protein
VINAEALAVSFVTLFVIMDPLGSIPVFVTLTGGRSLRQQAALAVQAAVAAGLLVVVFALFGRFVLEYLHITIQAVSIAGGLLLLLVALEAFRGDSVPVSDAPNIALVPLATPLLAGPGAIAAVMVLSARYSDPRGRAGLLVGIALVVVVIALGLALASSISRIVPKAWFQFLTRVFALLLSAIAVQLIIDAVHQIATAKAS